MKPLAVQQLVAMGVGPMRASEFLVPLQRTFDIYAINTPARRASFMAQCMTESTNLTQLEELLSYKSVEWICEVFKRLKPLPVDKLASLVRNPQGLAKVAYANINGNGNEASGDGWTYRGRGLIQLTGRANYEAAQIGLGRPYVAQPDLVRQPDDACLTAGFFWRNHDLNELADQQDIDGITRAVNGKAMREKERRRELFNRGLVAFA